MGVSKMAAAAVAAALLAAQGTNAFQTVSVKGAKFFYENGDQFYVKGAAYQRDVGQGGATQGSTAAPDPLSNSAQCKRDVPVLKKLGVNTIRTYSLDPSQNHDECMSMLQNAGIYVITDLGNSGSSINRASPQWTTDLYKHYTTVIDMMSKYENTLAFLAGNEVSNNKTNTGASAFVKAAVRDSKNYIAQKGGRKIPVGYATADVSDIRDDLAWYMNCGNNDTSIVDFYGLNIYEWCGTAATYQSSGYERVMNFYKNYSSALLFTEDGCNNNAGGGAGRKWTDVAAIFGPQMAPILNGFIAYEYFEEANDYGLVSVVNTDKVSTMADFTALSTQLAQATPSSVKESNYQPTNSPAPCPAISDTWQANGELLPPTPDENLCQCMFNSLSCVPASNLEVTKYGKLFGEVCGADKNACTGILANYTTGVYGTYSMCNSTQQLGFVLNEYYKGQQSLASACNFGGMANVVKGAGAASSCSASLASASSANSVAATATVAPTAASSSSFAVPMPIRSAVTLGDLAVGMYVLVAMGVGATMVLL